MFWPRSPSKATSGGSVAASAVRVDGNRVLLRTASLPRRRRRPEHRSPSSCTPTRPQLPRRHSSFGKRHASFGSPSEVPLPSTYQHCIHPHPSSQPSPSPSPVCSRPFFVRSCSATSLNTPRPSSPRRSLQVTSRLSLQEHEVLAKSTRSGSNGSQSSNVNSPSPPSSPDSPYIRQQSPSKEETMHTKTSIDDLGGQAAVADAMPRTDPRTSPGRWSSDQLRPPLFYPSSSHSRTATDLQASASTYSDTQFNSENHEMYRSGVVYAPKPTRPSSSSSLPLPSQTPFTALPSFGESQHTKHGGHHYTQHFGGLPQVNENVQSSYDSTPSPSHGPSRDLHSSEVNNNKSSTSSVPYHQLTISSLAQHSSPSTSSPTSSTPSLHTSSSSRHSSASSSLPPPTPPTVHTPPPPDVDFMSQYGSDDVGGQRGFIGPSGWADKRRSAPYMPFLNRAPPPKGAYIAVETMDDEYRLIVRLPGFKRDCIMISTRRKRMLHISADSWEAGGGHFERRISFGYDADLAHVRAEFDGEFLRVIVPRKAPPVTWFSGGTD